MDERSLEMTKHCQDRIKQVNDASSLKKFLEDYGKLPNQMLNFILIKKSGEFFSTRVQLGGRLFASTEIDSKSDDGRTKAENSMKAAAAVSFSGWGASAAVNTSVGSGGTQSTSQASSSSTTTLTWQANGGDTLLCNK